MKERNGYVTNSSSSSFIIAKRNLTQDQIEAIRHHSELGLKMNLDYAEESWDIEENKDYISGYTFMDNFNIYELFEKIGIYGKGVRRGTYRFNLANFAEEEIEGAEANENNNTEWEDLLYEVLNEK